MPIREITSLVSPPSEPLEVGEETEWAIIENELGTKLPLDYKKFVLAYGTGLFSNFIVVYNPYAKSEYLNLLSAVTAVSATNTELKEAEGKSFPYDIFPVSPGLLPWGKDENGNGLYWLTEGKPTRWPVVVGAGRDQRWQRFDYSMTTFLAKALKREIICDIWPKSFPNPGNPKHFQFKVVKT